MRLNPDIEFPTTVQITQCEQASRTVLAATRHGMVRMIVQQSAARCGRCGLTFDPADSSPVGRAQYQRSGFCRWCIDRCHEATEFDHECAVDRAYMAARDAGQNLWR